MTGDSFFLDIAKIAITIAGFAGVVAALRHPRDRGWKLNEIAGLRLMLEHSIFAVVLGLLPTVLYLYFADETVVWRWSSLVLSVFFAYELLINIARVRHNSAAGAPPLAFGLLLGAFFVPTVIFLYLQVQNVFFWKEPFSFAAGLLWLIVAACIQFTLFVTRVSSENEV